VNRSTLKVCPYCAGKGKIGITKYLPISKMQKLMKKYDLSQVKVSQICGITQTAVSNWFSTTKNTKGIKGAYFEMLAKKGYS
jgi:DNA-binding transcriptional regulator YiaG